MRKKHSRILALLMLILAAAWFLFALNNPQASFPWDNTVTYLLYGLYTLGMVVLFIAPFRRKE